MKEQVILVELTIMKGLFRKRPDTKLLALAITMKDAFLVMQFVGMAQDGVKPIAVLAAGHSTKDQSYVDEIIENIITYGVNKEVLETIPSSTKIQSSSITLSLKKPSEYIGSRVVFDSDSRLPDGYFFVNVKIKKKDYQPIVQYKIDKDIGKMKAMKKLAGSKFAAMTRNKLKSSFKLF